MTLPAIPAQTHATNRPKRIGTGCIRPRGVEEFFGISTPTRWRWERRGWLPKRDVFLGDKAIGWRPETIEAASRGPAANVA